MNVFKVVNKRTNETIVILDPEWRDRLGEIRYWGRNDLLICPRCKQPVTVRAGQFKRWHFAHKHLQGCPYGHESPVLLETRALLYQWLATKFPEKVTLEKAVDDPDIPRPIDCWVDADSGPIAYWLIDARMSPENRRNLKSAFKRSGAAVNWVFVSNLTPEQCKVVFTYETARVTLGHLIMKTLVGDVGAACMSILAVIAFISAMSAMTFLGPRVYSAMARDGFLPRILQGKEGKPPIGAVILQGAIALFLVFAYQLQQILNNVGAILTLFSALTVFSLFWIRFRKKTPARPARAALVSALFYLLLSGVMLYFGFKKSPTLNLWVGASILMALIGYFVTKKRGDVRNGRVPVQEEAAQ